MRIIVGLLLIFLTLPVWPIPLRTGSPGWSGNFHGPGLALMSASHKSRNCSEIFLALKQSANELRLLRSGYTCQDLQAEADPAAFAIKDGQIYQADGTLLGTITDQSIDITSRDPEEGFTFHWHWQRALAGTVSFTEEWMEGPTLKLSIQGQLAPDRD